MARESFLLRTEPRILNALRAWAEDDLRSVNGQLDFILRKALRDAGRFPKKEPPGRSNASADDTNENQTPPACDDPGSGQSSGT